MLVGRLVERGYAKAVQRRDWDGRSTTTPVDRTAPEEPDRLVEPRCPLQTAAATTTGRGLSRRHPGDPSRPEGIRKAKGKPGRRPEQQGATTRARSRSTTGRSPLPPRTGRTTGTRATTLEKKGDLDGAIVAAANMPSSSAPARIWRRRLRAAISRREPEGQGADLPGALGCRPSLSATYQKAKTNIRRSTCDGRERSTLSTGAWTRRCSSTTTRRLADGQRQAT